MNGERRAVFIINPAAGGLPRRVKLDAAIETASAEFGLSTQVVQTEAPGHATALAAEAEADGAELIIVCGGDGTLNEAINGVRSTEVAVGQVPGGTANVWAKEAGIPRNPEQALREQLSGPSVVIDAGRADERRFLLMASYGLDAAAVAAVNARLKRWSGPVAYIVAGIRVGVRYPGFRVRLRFDEGAAETVDAAMMVFGNTRRYGGGAQITRGASAVDGLLDCVVFRGHGVLPTLRMVPTVLRGRHLGSPRVLYRQAREVRIETIDDDALPPLQVDGDAEPSGATVVRAEAKALRMLAPRAERPVFRRGG
ncbi:MAG: diacylglycerol kinase family protein [Dehalococcoidia bacterium]